MVDDEVRKSWELNPQQFSITNPGWDSSIHALISRVGDALGFKGCAVDAVLYKFLLYEKGGHFKVSFHSF